MKTPTLVLLAACLTAAVAAGCEDHRTTILVDASPPDVKADAGSVGGTSAAGGAAGHGAGGASGDVGGIGGAP